MAFVAMAGPLREAEVSAQIAQMVAFIKAEASEKADEIRTATEEEFAKAREQVAEAEKARIRSEFARRDAQMDVKSKIAKSTTLNASRIEVLTARDEMVKGVLKAARKRLCDVANPASQEYAETLKHLVASAAESLAIAGEPTPLVVRCRACDLAPVRAAVAHAQRTLGDERVRLTLDEAAPLPPPPAAGAEDGEDDGTEACRGGVTVSTADGKVVADNTFDARLRSSFHSALPEVRKQLFAGM